jgi:hypothetical protein
MACCCFVPFLYSCARCSSLPFRPHRTCSLPQLGIHHSLASKILSGAATEITQERASMMIGKKLEEQAAGEKESEEGSA